MAVPALLDHLDRVNPVVRQGRFGLLVDFDGTIAEIAPTPDEATISTRSSQAIRRLANKLALVSVISGRSAQELAEKTGIEGVMYVGNHGVEYLIDGRMEVAPEAAGYRDRLQRAMAGLKAAADGPGIIWQPKGFGISVHYRLADAPEDTRQRLAEALKSVPEIEELEVFWGKMVLELRPPVGLDKGYAVKKLCGDFNLDSAVFVGDDVTDADALTAIRQMRQSGALRCFGVMVAHADSPELLSREADYALEGVRGVEDFLEWLLGAYG